MDPQINETTIVLKVTERIGDFPASMSQIQQAIQEAKKSDILIASVPEDHVRKMVISANTKMIQWQFLDMMQSVLKKIEPEISHYPEHQSIKYLESIIYQHLDSKIFQSVRISKIRTKLLGNTLESENLTMTDKLFTQLISVMNQLLQIMKEYYGLPRDERISGVLFQCISMFIAENQNCFLVEQDKMAASGIKKEGISKTTTGQSELSNSSTGTRRKSEVAIKTAQHLIGTLVNHIQQVNPFGSKKIDEKEIEQKKKLIKDMQHVKKRVGLNDDLIKIVQRLMGMSSIDIIKTMGKEQKAQFVAVLYDSLESISKIGSNAKNSKIKHIESEIVSMLEKTVDCGDQLLDQNLQKHREIKWIALLFKSLEKQYHTDTQRRKWLLQFCQNEYISKKVENPYSVIKILESQKLQESNIVKALRNLPLAVKIQESKKIDPANKKQVQAHLALEHELNRIHLYQLKKKYAKEPHLEFERLTNSKRRVITFLFSGFLSEDTCKVTEWSGLLSNFYDSEVYSVRWQSKTVKNMMEFAFKSVVDLGPTQSIAMLGGPYVKAIAIMHNLYQKFQENPFNPAFQSAIATGEFLAEFIMHNFKGYFINLVGFSLGTELIRNIMSKMAEKGCLNMLNKVYLLGGVADKSQVQKLIEASPSPLTVINLYSDNDYILKYLLRICKRDIVPVGLNPLKQIQGHIIKNEDCTYYVEGHLSYRANLQFFCKLLKMADD